MVGDLTIGIDVGTTAVKAGLFDQTGALIDGFAQPYPTTRIGDRVEQDAGHWTAAIDAALAQFAGHAGNVAAIGLSAQVNTHIFVGADGTPLAPAIVWQDGRAAAEAAELDAHILDAQRIAWWGAPMPIDASHALSRMLWVARNEPQIWQDTSLVMLPKDHCIRHLTGEIVTDALSNIGLADQHLDYIPAVLDLVPGASQRLAPVKTIDAIAGTVRTGPFAGTPVANGTMDGWTGLLGLGGYKEGTTAYLSGTSEVLGITATTVNPTPGVVVLPQCAGVRIHAGPTQTGGAAQLWYCQLTGSSPQAMAAQAAASDMTRPAPLFLPHLQGERAPLWKPHLRAGFIGMDQQTAAPDLARAVYEGVAFSARMVLDALETSSGIASPVINCGGGGFQSDIWNQIRANVLGRQLRRLAIKDPGILAAAGIAGWAAGLHPTLSSAFEQIVRFDADYHPDPALTGRYDALFQAYLEAINANEPINQSLLDIRDAGA